MFSNLFEWLLIIAVLVIIFNANNLSSWKENAHKKLENIKKIAGEKKAEFETKIKESKNKKDKE